MPTDFIDAVRNCHNCGATLPLGTLACETCHALTHSEDLVRISVKAKSLEEQGDLVLAREEWSKALPLLPANSTQAEWIRGHLYKLEIAAKNAAPPKPQHAWAKKLGPLAPIAVLLAKGKGLLFAILKLKFLWSLGLFLAIYWARWGAKFAVGLALLLLIHEMGHYLDIRRRGLPADMPVFLPGLGAYVRWNTMGVTRQTRAAVSLAGPLAGLLAAAVCAVLWYRTQNEFWAALASLSAAINLLNLIPIWILDGGQAANALSKTERFVLLAAALLLGLIFSQPLFLLIAGGIIYRLFTKDLPPMPSPAIAVYFVAVMTALAVILKWMPTPPFEWPKST